MNYTLREAQTAAIRRFVDGISFPPSLLQMEANAALEDLYKEVKVADSRLLDKTARYDLKASQDFYTFPAIVDSIVMLERLDLGSVAVPLRRVSLRHMARSRQMRIEGYVEQAPRSVILLQKPTAATKGGLRLTYFPTFSVIVDDRVTPQIPDHLFDHWISRLVERMASFDTVAALAHPQETQHWIRENKEKLLRLLRPPSRDGATPLMPKVALYR